MERRTRVVIWSWTGALALVVASCGSGGGADSAATTKPKAGSTTTSTTSTTTTVPEADEETAALAEAALFTEGDLGAPWAPFADAEDFEREGEADPCLNPEGSVLRQLPDGARGASEIFQHGEDEVWVRTTSAVFPDEQTAEEWVAFTSTADYQECLRADVEEANRPDSGEWEVVDGTTDEMRTSEGSYGTEHVALFEGRVDGEVRSQLYLTTYRVGRAVIWVHIDVGGIDSATLDSALEGEASARGTAFDRAAQAQGIEAPGA